MRKAVVQAARLGGKKGSSNKDRSNGKNDDRESAREGNGHNNGNGNNGYNGNHTNNGNGLLSSLHEHTGVPMPMPKLRKTTPEEAALTAKNYRLAKELVCTE
jgi:hypothetical protein